MTIRKKLYYINLLNAVGAIALAIATFWGVDRLDPRNSALGPLTTTLKYHMESDIIHNSLRTDVLRALSVAASGDVRVGSKEQALADVSEHVRHYRMSLSEANNIQLPAEIKQQLAEVNQISQNYLQTAEEIVKDSFTNYSSAVGAYAAFEKTASELGELNNKVSNAIQVEAEKVRESDIRAASFLHVLLWVMCFLGVVVTAVLSVMLVRGVVRALNSVIRRLEQSAKESKNSAGNMAVTAQSLSTGATEQGSAIQETVASISEMLSMVGHTAESAKLCLDSAGKMSQKTDAGNDIMERLAKSMEMIQQTNSQLQTMSSIIHEISTKTTVINDIVFKTQLLSFNASIEAARAGQHGRGFAVVAEEVGNLAETSGNAAKEIQNLLEASRKQVENIVESVQQRVDDGQVVTRQALEIFGEIANESTAISSRIQQINDAASEQEVGLQQISSAMDQLDQSTVKNNKMAADTSTNAQRLAAQSNRLSQVVTELVTLVHGNNVSNVAKSQFSSSQKDLENKAPDKRRETEIHELDQTQVDPDAALDFDADDESFRPYQ